MLYCIQRFNLYTNIRSVYLEMQRGQTLLQKGQTPSVSCNSHFLVLPVSSVYLGLGYQRTFLFLGRQIQFVLKLPDFFFGVISLHVCPHSLSKVTLPIRLAPCITAAHRVQLHNPLAVTVTGLTAASMVQLCWTHCNKKGVLQIHMNLLDACFTLQICQKSIVSLCT